jgi:flagellar biogenesis protein FliO
MIVTALLLAAVGTAIVVALAMAWALRRLVAKFEPSRSPASGAERLLRSFAAGLSAALAFRRGG